MKRKGAARPRVAVFKFASCDGCQLALLDAEEHLLAFAAAVEIAHFPEATSLSGPPPYDIGLVEGSVVTHEDAERIQEIRRRCRILVTIGACATAGGIQALRNLQDAGALIRAVYPQPALVRTLATSTPISEHVPVEFELRGCPIAKEQLLDLVGSLLAGRRPNLPAHPVCLDCKRRGTTCVLVARGLPCLGPVTQTGCGAICPAYGRACYGCFGPSETPNTASLVAILRGRGLPDEEIARLFRGVSGWSWPFRHAASEIAP